MSSVEALDRQGGAPWPGGGVLRTLCVVGSSPQFNELLDAVEALEQRGTPVESHFDFDEGFRPSLSQRSRLAERRHNFDSADTSDVSTKPAPPVWRALVRKALAFLPRHAAGVGIEAFRMAAYAQAGAIPFWYRRYHQHYLACRRRLSETRPSVILLAVDAVTYGTGAWVRAAREAGIPSVLIPFAMADRYTLISERFPIPAYWVAGPTSRYVAARYPQWVERYQGRRVLVLPAAQALAKQLAGIVEALPWTYNDSKADVTLLESEHARQQLIADGASTARLLVTGRPAHDRLATAIAGIAEKRESMQRDVGLDPALPLVVASVTPDKFDVYGAQTEFKSYREMLEFWADTMMNSGRCNVLASVHPSQPVESVKFLERRGLVVTHRPLAEILPMAELFVVDCSATSRLAAASGIPVLDYDLYGFDLKFNQVGNGLVHVKTRAQFQEAWRLLWQEPERLGQLKAAQLSNAAEFGLLDGGAGRRMADAIVALCLKKEVDQNR